MLKFFLHQTFPHPERVFPWITWFGRFMRAIHSSITSLQLGVSGLPLQKIQHLLKFFLHQTFPHPERVFPWITWFSRFMRAIHSSITSIQLGVSGLPLKKIQQLEEGNQEML